MGRAKFTEWLTPEGLAQIMLWRREGLELGEIAKNMGIAAQTLSEWQNRFPEIREALKRGNEIAVQIVENALFKSAVGYEYEEVTHELSLREEPRLDKDGIPMEGLTDSISEMVETKRVKKVQPPNATSMIFFLKNRDPRRWNDVNNLHLTGGEDIGKARNLSQVPTEELRSALERIEAVSKHDDETEDS